MGSIHRPDNPPSGRRPSATVRSLGRRPLSGFAARRLALGRMLLALLAVGVIWRVARFAAGASLWGDEAFLAVTLLTRDFAGLLRPLDYHQLAPVGFLWAELAVVRLLGPFGVVAPADPVPGGPGVARAVRPVREPDGRPPVGPDRGRDLRGVVLPGPARDGGQALCDRPPRRAGRDPAWPGRAGSTAGRSAGGRAWRRRWRSGVWFSYPLVFVAAGVGLVLGWGVIGDRDGRWAPRSWRDSPDAFENPGSGVTPRDRRSLVGLGMFGLVTAASWVVSYLAVRPAAIAGLAVLSRAEDLAGGVPAAGRGPGSPARPGSSTSTPGTCWRTPTAGTTSGAWATAILGGRGSLVITPCGGPALLALLLGPLVPTLVASSLHRYPYGTSARTTRSTWPRASACWRASAWSAIIRRLPVGPGKRGRSYRLVGVLRWERWSVATVVNVGPALQELRGHT